MGCIVPKSPYLPIKDKYATIDFKDFFIINNKNTIIEPFSVVNPQSCDLKTKSIEVLSDITLKIEEKVFSKVLTIDMFKICQILDGEFPNKPDDVITIINNTIQSNQGMITKDNGIFSFGKKTEESTVLDYNIENDNYISPYQFEISYINDENKYYINETKQSSGLFNKIDNCLFIRNGLVVNYCNNNMKFILDNSKNGNLELQFLDGELEGKVLSFTPEKNTIIRLGRSKTNEIFSQKDSISRIQWTIVYKKNLWIIYDGGFEGKKFNPSSNGLWLLITEKSLITNDSLWKTGEKIFLAKID